MNHSIRHHPQRSLIIVGAIVIAWFALAEFGTEVWYRYNEKQFTPTEPWNMKLPDPEDIQTAQKKGFYSFVTREIGDREKEILLFETGTGATWSDTRGNAWNAFLITWPPGKVLGDMDSAHNPATCLPAAGFELVEIGPMVSIPVNGTEMKFQSWIFRQSGTPVFAFMAVRRKYANDVAYLIDRATSMGPDRLYHRMGRALSRAKSGIRPGSPLESVQLIVSGPRTLEEATELAKQQILNLQG